MHPARKPSDLVVALLFFEDEIAYGSPQWTHASLANKLWSLRHSITVCVVAFWIFPYYLSFRLCDMPCTLGIEYVPIGAIYPIVPYPLHFDQWLASVIAPICC